MSKPIHVPQPEKWVDNYGDYLFGFAMTKISDPELARDLIQETFISALNALSDFRGDASEKTWLTSILKRKIIDHYRKNFRNKEISVDGMYDPFTNREGYNDVWDIKEMPKIWNNAESNFETDEFYLVLKECMQKLPEQLRSVFVMRVIDEINSDEVCKALNISSSNLWVILHRCRLVLRKCFEIKWVE